LHPYLNYPPSTRLGHFIIEYLCAMRINGLLLFILILSGCAKTNFATYEPVYSKVDWEEQPDYSQLKNWAAHPYKNDPSDSLPHRLAKNFQPKQLVDVFFVHPTTYLDPAMTNGWSASLKDIALNIKTDFSTILSQASIFNEVGTVYAPRYRQAHINSYYPKSKLDTLNALAAFELAYQDVKKAFDFYLTNYNQNKPIIIAAHSQGSTHAKRLLKEYFDGKALSNQLVTAYIVGMAIDPAEFTSLKSCNTPTETGCICAWRTFKEGYIPPFVQIEKFNSIVTNPLTWDSNQPFAARDANPGSVLYNFNKVIPKVAGAINHEGVLWTPYPKFFGNVLFNTSNYHIADYNFYYMSVRKNATDRAMQFLSQPADKSH
jgi:hypothetical protein